MHTLRKLLIALVVLIVVAITGVVFVYQSIPTADTNLTHFDTIIVLGPPANPDGTPSPEQRERTLEGVREFKAGVASNLILTGGPAHNQYVEAHVMATLAIAQGVPPNAVIEEGRAQNTIQNIFYSQRIMAEHGWTSAEVVSSPSHLPRTALILGHYPIALAHSLRSVAASVHVMATSSPFQRGGAELPQVEDLWLSPHTLSPASCMIFF
jgi:uncharacterized SAM-binding protein YcdF (DUF218 family)